MDLTTLNWLNAFLFFLLIAGHTAFWVAYVNRSHALPISCDRLHHLRRAHDIALPAFPIALVVWPGYFAPGLLVNSQAAWSQLSLPWVAYLSVCGLGTVGLAWRIFQWQTRRPPHCLVDHGVHVVPLSDTKSLWPMSRRSEARHFEWH